MRQKKFTLPIFGFRYKVVIVETTEEAKKEYSDWEDEVWGRVYTDRHGHAEVVIRETSSYASIAHECLHLKDHILSYFGVKPDYENDELDAYLLAHLFQNVKDLKEGK